MKKHKAIVLKGDTKDGVLFEMYYVDGSWQYWGVLTHPVVHIKSLLMVGLNYEEA